jgi:hypothetical protein
MVHELGEENAEAEEQSLEPCRPQRLVKVKVCVGRDLQTDSVSQIPHWARLRMSKTQSHVIVNRKLVLTTAD